MVRESEPYTKVYWSITDDPLFADVWLDDRALATWVRMLVDADAMYPRQPKLPPRVTPAMKHLIEVGLVIPTSMGRYTVLGLEKERERRSARGRAAAHARYATGANGRTADAVQAQYERSAPALLGEERRGDKRRGEERTPTRSATSRPSS